MSKEFTDRLINPARKAGKQAGDAISGGLDGAVKNLEKQVKASQGNLDKLDAEYEKKRRRQSLREEQEKEAKELLRRAEERYNKAVEEGSKTTDTAYKQLSAAKVKAKKAATDLADAQADANFAEKKHKDQLDDYNKTVAKHEQAQREASAEVTKATGPLDALREKLNLVNDEMLDTVEHSNGWGSKITDGLGKIGAGALLGVGAKIGNTVMDGVGTAFGKGFDRLGSIEQAETMLSGLGNSASEVDSIMDSAMESVSGTAFGFGEAAKMAATFSGAGIKEGEELTRILSLVGDTASITGADFNEMGSIWTKVATGQRMSTEEMNQLMDRGLGVLPELQKHYGVTAEEARKMVSDGKVDFEDFSEIMENMVGGSAQAMGDTFAGSAANMQAALGRVGAKLLEPVYENAPAVFQAIGGAVDKLGEHLGPVIEDFSERLSPYIEDFSERLGPWLEKTIDNIAAVMGDWVDKGKSLVDWIVEYKEYLGPFAAGIATVAGAFILWQAAVDGYNKAIEWGTNLTKIFDKVAKAGVWGAIALAIAAVIGVLIWFFTQTETGQELWEKFTGAIADGWDWVTDKIGSGVEWLQEKFGEISDFVTGVTDILFHGDYSGLPFGLGEDSSFVDWLFTAREKTIEFKDNVIAAWGEVKTAFTGGDDGYGALASIFGEDSAEDIINIVADIGERFVEFKDNAVAAFEDAKKFAQPFFDMLAGFFTEQMGEVFSSIGGALGDIAGAFLDIAGALGGALWDVLQSVFDLFKSLWDLLSPFLLPVLKIIAGIVGGLLVGAFLGFVGAIRVAAEIIEFLADVIGWAVDNFLVPLLNIAGDIASFFIEGFALAIQGFGDYFGEVFGGIKSVWDGFTDLLYVGYEFVTATVFDGIGAGLGTLRENFSTAVDAITKIWDGIKEAAAAPVRFMVNTVWNDGIIRAIDAVAGVIGMEGPDQIQLGFARGGILPGYSRMADGDDQLVPMRRGEGVLVSEGLQDDRSRRLFLSVNEQAKRGKSFGEFMTDYVAGYANGGIVGSLNSIMREFYPELQMTSHFRPGDSGYHGKNMAADFSNTGSGMPSTPAMQAAAKFMFGNYGDQLEQLIHHPARNIGSGRDVGDGFGYYGAGTMYEHTDHIHLAALKPLVDPSGVVQMMPYDGESGGAWWNPLTWAKKAWDAVVNAIAPYPDEGEGWFSQIPGNFLTSAAGKIWDWVTGKIGAGSFDGAGGTAGNAESWRDMAIAAMRRNGFNADDPAQVNAMIAQIQSESSGNPSAIQGIIDVNSGGNEAAGLLQVIPGTFADHRDPSLPDDRLDAWANMNAALRYYKSKYGTDLTAMWGHGHGYSEGGIVDLFTRDLGGWVPNGALVRNTSGRDELMLPPELSKAMAGFFKDYPEAAKVLLDAAEHIQSASEFLNKAAVYQSEEGVTARQTARGVLNFGLDLPGSDVVLAVLDGEEQIWAARERQLGHLDTLVEKEKAIKDARKALADLEKSEDGLSRQEQRKLDDAKKAVEEAKADAAKAESDEKRASAAEKVADAEEKLKRVREDLDANAEENAKKRAEEITSANEAVIKAEEEYAAARQQQVKDLDHITVLSQSNFADMASQATSIAGQLVSMGAPAGAVASGLSAVTGALGQASAMAGPAGVSLGMALQAVSVGIQLVEMVVTKIKELIDFINRVRLEALQATAEGLQVIADYASLVTDMQRNIGSLQQEIVRGMTEQRTAELNLRVAQQDRLVAEAEGMLAVHEARLALDEEIRKGQVAAQIRMMGLHEDWDSYMSFQALVGQGVLQQWSDAAISALFTYEQARAKALQGELQARVEQINAEAALAEATRANVRNQQDLLTAQERLIRMSAEVAGIDLVDATATSQVANLVVQMAELQQKMDSNWAGKAGAFLGTSGPWSNEYRGQKAAMDGMRAALDAVLAETGVSLSNSQINKAIEQMKWVSATEGDPLAVLRQFMPELVAAETALKIDEVMKPIDDARDAQRDAERETEDFKSEIDLYEKLAPLEELIKGLDYTIEGLGKASDAWADGNEDLRAEYLAAAQANRDAARELGVSWGLDDRYATGAVREQITKEVTIHLDGREVYTADQVDELLAAVTSGSNVRVNVDKSAKSVATSRRGGMA
ncbi:tape measure protein [Corynebacterium casei]|uniref:tape measure protein n=1 Tax=Corynebacterium casei TaxID=160386 RepID=UPI003FD23B30